VEILILAIPLSIIEVVVATLIFKRMLPRPEVGGSTAPSSGDFEKINSSFTLSSPI
jgi:hypothetical protein